MKKVLLDKYISSRLSPCHVGKAVIETVYAEGEAERTIAMAKK